MKEFQEKITPIVEKREYPFEKGVEQIIKKTEALLAERDFVVVTIAGPASHDWDVGKTTLSQRLSREYSQQKIPRYLISDYDSLQRFSVPDEIKDGGVVIFGAGSSPGDMPTDKLEGAIKRYRDNENYQLQKAASLVGLPLSKVDLHVLISRPDVKIENGDQIYADVIIQNEFAKDKWRKDPL
ncbi:MAG: hypothetical protein PHU42_01645 [Patescibacteria group bacterium]|nr:hypothetical protein [Patescibacteria group bacterium]